MRGSNTTADASQQAWTRQSETEAHERAAGSPPPAGSDDRAVVVRGLTKRFRMRSEPRGLSLLGGLGRGLERRKTLVALDDVTFDARRGETLGIVGMNGSGKSTLLKIIAGIAAPTAGTVEVRGRVNSLIELGAGFHPELSGYENVYLNATILGIARSEIDDLLPRIVEFSGLEGFMDMPVKHYSSGMYMRLGFAIAIQIRPDVLLLDETMAVGDAQFQSRALRAIQDFKSTGATTFMVSHDIFTVREYCDRVVWLDKGRIAKIGDPRETVEAYLQFLTHFAGGQVHSLLTLHGEELYREPRTPESPLDIVSLDVLGPDGRPAAVLDRPERIALSIRYACRASVERARVCVSLVRPNDKSLALEKDSVRDGAEIGPLAREGEIRFSFDSAHFLEDAFEFVVAIYDRADPTRTLDRAVRRFDVVGRPQPTPDGVKFAINPCPTFEHRAAGAQADDSPRSDRNLA